MVNNWCRALNPKPTSTSTPIPNQSPSRNFQPGSNPVPPRTLARLANTTVTTNQITHGSTSTRNTVRLVARFGFFVVNATHIPTQLSATTSSSSIAMPASHTEMNPGSFASASFRTAATRKVTSITSTTTTGPRNCRRNAINCPLKMSRTVSGVDSSSSSAPIFRSSPSRRPASDATQSVSIVFTTTAVSIYTKTLNQ